MHLSKKRSASRSKQPVEGGGEDRTSYRSGRSDQQDAAKQECATAMVHPYRTGRVVGDAENAREDRAEAGTSNDAHVASIPRCGSSDAERGLRQCSGMTPESLR